MEQIHITMNGTVCTAPAGRYSTGGSRTKWNLYFQRCVISRTLTQELIAVCVSCRLNASVHFSQHVQPESAKAW